MSDEDGFFEHPAERFFLSQTYRLLKFRPRHIQFFRILLEACFGASWGVFEPYQSNSYHPFLPRRGIR